MMSSVTAGTWRKTTNRPREHIHTSTHPPRRASWCRTKQKSTYQRHPQVHNPAVQQQGREIRRRSLRFVVIVRRGSSLARGPRARRHDGRLGRRPQRRVVDDRRSLVFAGCGAQMPCPDLSIIRMYPIGNADCPWEARGACLHRAAFYRENSWPCARSFRLAVLLVCPADICDV